MTWKSLDTMGGAHLNAPVRRAVRKNPRRQPRDLGRIGVRVDLEEARVLLKKGGAQVEGNLVRVPAKMVESALLSAPKKVTLHNRRGEPVMPMERWQSLFLRPRLGLPDDHRPPHG